MKDRICTFTLLELLLVITVIIILSSILLPALQRTRERAKQLTCLAKEKQLGTGILMYAGDYDSYIVRGVIYDTDYKTWTYKIAPYCSSIQDEDEAKRLRPDPTSPNYRELLKKNEIFICPSASWIWAEINSGLAGYVGNYAINGDLMTVQTPATGIVPQKRLSSLKKPTKCGLLWESKDGACALNLVNITLEGCSYGVPDFRHSASLNLLYADGHTSAVKKTFILPIAYTGSGNNDLWE